MPSCRCSPCTRSPRRTCSWPRIRPSRRLPSCSTRSPERSCSRSPCNRRTGSQACTRTCLPYSSTPPCNRTEFHSFLPPLIDYRMQNRREVIRWQSQRLGYWIVHTILLLICLWRVWSVCWFFEFELELIGQQNYKPSLFKNNYFSAIGLYYD